MLGLSKGWELDRKEACLPLTSAKSKRATCLKLTRCGQACASPCLGSKEIVRIRLELGFVYISQLIRFARATSYVADFNTRNKLLTQTLLKQGYRYHKLRKTFSKFIDDTVI